jgi:hypothetical protein
MSTTRKPAAPPAGETPAEAPAPEPAAAAEPTAGELLERAQVGLLTVITNAVSAETGHGVDIVLAQQAANVYQTLFGESR